MKRTRRKRPRKHVNLVPIVGIILGIAGLILSFGGHLQQYNQFNWQQLEIDFYANAGTELISIAITVVVIDTLYRFRERRQYKAQLIRQLGSGDRSSALQAVQELKAEEWFYDTTMHNARLWHADLSTGQMHYANLEGADLRVANLREAELKGANLRNARLKLADLRGSLLTDADLTEATLERANLKGSNITLAQIQSAKTLVGAIMPDGSPYEHWCNQIEPITLAERKLELNKYNSEWFSKPAAAPTQRQQMPLLWVGVGLGTAVLGQMLLKFVRKR